MLPLFLLALLMPFVVALKDATGGPHGTWALPGGSPVRRDDNDTQPDFTPQQLYNMTINFWDQLMYPNNCAQSKSINSTLLAVDVQGRVDETRNFEGRELNTEYLYGLFCNLAGASSINLIGTPLSYNLTQYLASGNLSASTATVNVNLTAVNWIAPITISAFINFNSLSQIAQYDVTFKWADWQFATIFARAQALLGTNSTAATQAAIGTALATEICQVESKYCTGSLKQYNSTQDCMSFLTTQTRFGEAWELGMDTLMCRDVHVNMVPYRPEVHCAHIGPSGGGYCTDNREYESYVRDPFFTTPGMLQIPS